MNDEPEATAADAAVQAGGAPSAATAQAGARLRRLAQWLVEAARSTLGLRARLDGLRATPAGLAVLLVLALLIDIAAQRVLIDGPARFYPQAIQSGWLASLVSLWLCWLVVRQRDGVAASAAEQRASVAVLFGLLMLQYMLIATLCALALAPLVRLGGFGNLPPAGQWLLWALPWLWPWAAALALLLRQLPSGLLGHPLRALVVTASMLSIGLAVLFQPPSFWYALPAVDEADADATRLHLSPALFEHQIELLDEAIDALVPERPGQVDVYSITFAPYGGVEVFRRESALVSRVMRERFDAEGRTLELVNHAATANQLPWATAENLERAIAEVAEHMNREEDLLFIHLTSHGGRDGRLEASLWPLEVEPVTPQQLEAWLDAAGVRYRVISVSACYSGSWIEPLAGDGALVMTAADAEHTSYGCGQRSELTFFGRAMYDDALRQTHSFEQAHRQARTLIEQREKEAGKDDGYSNPQISVGAGVRAQLARLEAHLGVAPAAAPASGSLQ